MHQIIKKWPLWLKWGICLAVLDGFLLFLYSYLGSHYFKFNLNFQFTLGALVSLLNIPAFQIAYLTHIVFLGFLLAILQWFAIGAIIGLIIQKKRNKKAV